MGVPVSVSVLGGGPLGMPTLFGMPVPGGVPRTGPNGYLRC